ncbi:MAG: FHA domain-containing protein, partial [Tepidimonas sp.]
LIEIARYQLRVVDDATPALATATATATPPPTVAQRARLEVLDGPAAGRTVALTKAATTIGKPGVAVATVTHRGTDYVLTQAAGERPATLNGQAIGPAGATLHDGDVIALAGSHIRFVLC